VTALRSQLNWSQYRLLVSVDDNYKREYYELEAINNAWTGREMERRINAALYERLLLSNDKEAVLAVARKERIPEHPTEIIKDPMILEFLGLKREAAYYEKDFESALITHLQEFLLEMGNGFSFVARQKRILLKDDEFFVDAVFYNRLLRCFVIIEIKTHKISHVDLGQLQMYVNYFDRREKLPDENPTVGILLCADKNDTPVRFSLPEDNTTILTSKYQLYLPSEKDLLEEIKDVLKITGDEVGERERESD
jgi:predicted nuclease of restriction endonuclease-like (RecB) superfamily